MTDNLLRRRINYNRFKEDDAPSRETIESILKEAITCAPVKGSFKYVNLDVWGPEHQQIKDDLVKVTGVKESGLKWWQNREIPTEEWEEKLELHYSLHPEDFNNQVRAPYVIAVVENPHYFELGPNPDYKVAAKEKSGHDNKKAVYLRIGTLAYALAMSANRHGVDASYCGCLNMKLDTKLNKICLDYHSDGRDILFFLGLGYFDFDAQERGAAKSGGWEKIDDEWIEHSGGGRYNIKTRQREGHKKKKPDYNTMVRWR